MSYGNYIDFTKVKKVLVVKLRHHGDVLLSGPVFSTLKNKFPHLTIDALIYADTKPMLEGHPSIRKFLCYNKKWKEASNFTRFKNEFLFYKEMRKEDYDLVINLTEGDRGALICFISNASYKVGFDPGKGGFMAKRKVYTHIAKKVQTPRHTVEKDLDVLRRIGVFPGPPDKELFIAIPEQAGVKIASLLEKFDMETGKYLVIHPVSRWRFKCPPMSWFVALIKELEKRRYKVILTASADPIEMEMIKAILLQLGDTSVVSLAGATSLKELTALIKGAKALITVDSVPLHIASALKTPVIALFGPSSDLNWGPWNHPHGHVVTERFSCRPCFLDGCGGSKVSDCLSDIPLEKVLSLL